MTPGDARHKGSKCDVKVMWEDGSVTWEPLTAMTAADPVTSAAHAKEHDLLNAPGWKKPRRIARRAKVLQRMMNNSKRAQRCDAVVHKFGVRIPRNVKEAKMSDEENGNTLWMDMIKLELKQLEECNTCRKHGKECTRSPWV